MKLRALKIYRLNAPVSLKVLILQAYIIGKFRYLLISLFFYPAKNIEQIIEK